MKNTILHYRKTHIRTISNNLFFFIFKHFVSCCSFYNGFTYYSCIIYSYSINLLHVNTTIFSIIKKVCTFFTKTCTITISYRSAIISDLIQAFDKTCWTKFTVFVTHIGMWYTLASTLKYFGCITIFYYFRKGFLMFNWWIYQFVCNFAESFWWIILDNLNRKNGNYIKTLE